MRRPLAIGLATAVAVTALLALDLANPVELPLRDFVLRAMPDLPAEATVVVEIDERSLREVGPWPWPRATLAQLLDRLAEAQGRAAIFDILLADPRPGDELLAQSMTRIDTIAVSVLVEGQQWLVPAPLLQKNATIAHGNFELDHDGIHRRFATTKQNGARSDVALSFEAAMHYRVASVPVGQTIAPMFRTPPRAIPRVSATDMLAGRVNVNLLRGRLLFIGPTALGLGDRVLTPVSNTLTPDPGVTVHAAATESLIRQERIYAMPPLVSGLFAGVAVAAIVRVRRRWLMAAVLLTIALGGFALFLFTGIAVPFATLLFTALLASIVVEARTMTASQVRLEQIATRMAEQRAQEIESKRLLAHELKTPLASMRGLTQLLSGFELSDVERRRVASLLEAEAGKLQSMVTALLDLERLPLRDFHASTAVTDLGDLVSARVSLLRAGSNRRIDADTPRGILVRGDAMLLERVADNLAGNALKYTKDAIDVRVRGGEAAVLEVEDRGPGISEAERERIFARFFRGRSAAGTEGLGLGLSFVAEVARWHGGRVEVVNGAAGGSVFRFILPLAEKAGNEAVEKA